jgi:hypothetical protein
MTSGGTMRKFRKGDQTVAKLGRIADAGPMDCLLVTKVHSDGTVDLKVDPRTVRGDSRRWERVDPDCLESF